MNRISREDMFMAIARTVAHRGTCPRASVGAIIVREGRIVSTGYNGSPPGAPHCVDVGCDLPPSTIVEETGEIIRSDLGCQRATHAECNAIVFAARLGIATDVAGMYCTHAACAHCAKMIVSAGITEFIYQTPYRFIEGIQFLKENGVSVIQDG
jgi:dCMP deaminase